MNLVPTRTNSYEQQLLDIFCAIRNLLKHFMARAFISSDKHQTNRSGIGRFALNFSTNSPFKSWFFSASEGPTKIAKSSMDLCSALRELTNIAGNFRL